MTYNMAHLIRGLARVSASGYDDICLLVDELDSLRQQVERLREALQDIAEYDCVYGDGCPTFGTNHGQCHGCVAREALEDPK